MRILVIGAAGRTGTRVVERALGHGHDVRAFVHRTPLTLSHRNLEVIEGDATEFESVEQALDGISAVAVAVGGSDSSGRRIHEATAEAVLHAMAARDVSKAAFVSARGAFARNDPHMSLAFRTLIATTMRGAYDDFEAAERRIMASGIDWTIVRPAALSDAPASGRYRVSLDGSIPGKLGRLSRDDLASVVVKALETDTFYRKAIVVGG